MPLLQPASSSTTTFPVDNLGYVVVYVHQEYQFPPAKNSAADAALIRAANLYLQRKQAGIEDLFLFVFPSIEAINEDAIRRYGFSSVELRVTSEPKERMQGGLELFPVVDLDATSSCSCFRSIRDEIGEIVSGWLQECHPTAIPFLLGGYDQKYFWWQGIRCAGESPSKLIEIAALNSELPLRHREKGATWLGIAKNAGLLSAGMHESEEFEDALNVAALCEWLHGFDAVSGDGENEFSGSSVMRWLPISELALGFEAGKLTQESIWLLCEERDRDIGSMAGPLLRLLVETKRSQIRDSLSRYFGGDENLLYSLLSIVSADYSRPMLYQREEILSLLDRSFDELADAWNFVQEGWHDRADADYDG